MPTTHPNRLPTILLTIAVLLTFSPLLAADFVSWDDLRTIAENPRLNPPTVAGTLYYWTHAALDLYMPATYTFWSLLAAAAHTSIPDPAGITLNPTTFHAANLLLHLCTTLLVHRILLRLVPQRWPAFIGTLLFALHPVQVEPVGWISGAKDLLAGLFAIASIWQYLRYADTHRRTHYALATLAYALAMLSKPAAITTPLAILAIDVLILHRPWRKSATALAPWLLLAIPIAIITKLVQPTPATFTAPLWSRPLIAADSLATYLHKLVWPAHLTIDYGRSPEYVLATHAIYWTWLLPALLLILCSRVRRTRPWLLAAAAISVSFLLPVLGLVKFDFQRHSTVADHYLYAALLGPAIASAFLLSTARARWLYPLSICAILAISIRSFLQTSVWHDSTALYTHAVEVNPTTLAGNDGLGNMALTANRLDQAIPRFQAAVAGHPTDPIANYNLANALALADRPREAAAAYRLALAGPQFSFAYANYADALAQSGDLPAAARTAEEGLEKWPDEPRLHLTLASVFAAQKDWPAAADEYAAALRLSPNLTPAREGLATARRHLAPATKP